MLQKLIKNIVCILIIVIVSTGTIASATGIDSEWNNSEISETPEPSDIPDTSEEPEILPDDIQNTEEPEPEEFLTGWQEIEGKRYYFSLDTGEMVTGWQEIEDKTYYFLPDTGELVTSWQDIDWETYYFLPDTGEMATGWQEIDLETYYFLPDTGEMQLGRQKIGKNFYFFAEDGILQTSGLVKDYDVTYYCNAKGVLISGWKKIKGYKYYFSKDNNEMFTGLHKIKNDYYIFDKHGHLAQSDGISIVKVAGNIYCAGEDGKAVSGWQIKGKKLYYATKKGKVKRNTKYQGIVLTETGAAKDNTNSKLKIQVIKVINSITNENMSKSSKLSACWSYIVRGGFHYASKYPNLNSSGWPRSTAYNMLSTHSGNCYSYACAFAALASEIGYKPYIVCGRVHGSRDRAADGYTRHAWVRINGLNYDPEAQYAGWMRGIYARRSYPAAHQIQKVVAY